MTPISQGGFKLEPAFVNGGQYNNLAMAKNILVIDDDYLVTRTVGRYLRSLGYNVETAQSGKEALDKIGE